MKKFTSYKNWVNEKFTDESDPIKDMGIGIDHERNFNDQIEMHRWVLKHLPHILGTEKIPEDILKENGCYLNQDYQHIIEDYFAKYITFNNEYDMTTFLPGILHRMLAKRGYKVKKVHENKINEKFTDESDPIMDMGIGMMGKIDKFMAERYRWIQNPTLAHKLYYSVQRNEEEFVQYLISKLSYEEQNYGFFQAIRTGNKNIVKMFIDNGILKYFNYYTSVKYPSNHPIFVAAQAAKSEILKYLFDEIKKDNAIIDQKILDEALTVSCILVYTRSARVLLDHGAKITEILKYKIERWLRRNKKVKVTNLLKQYNLI